MKEYIRDAIDLAKDSSIREWFRDMVKELKPLLWFLAFILFLYVIAPSGFF